MLRIADANALAKILFASANDDVGGDGEVGDNGAPSSKSDTNTEQHVADALVDLLSSDGETSRQKHTEQEKNNILKAEIRELRAQIRELQISLQNYEIEKQTEENTLKNIKDIVKKVNNYKNRDTALKNYLDGKIIEGESQTNDYEKCYTEGEITDLSCINTCLTDLKSVKEKMRKIPTLVEKDMIQEVKTLFRFFMKLKKGIRFFVRYNPTNHKESFECWRERNWEKPDLIFDPKIEQEKVYEEFSFLVENFLDGENCVVMSYGQSGSGKTYTMIGKEKTDSNNKTTYDINESNEDNGIIPRIVKQIFEDEQISINFLFFEIKIQSDKNGKYPSSKYRTLPYDKEVSFDKWNKFTSAGVGEQTVKTNAITATNYETFLEKFNLAISQRWTEETDENKSSSRSHFCIQMTKTDGAKGTMFLADLAGSEDVSKKLGDFTYTLKGKAKILNSETLAGYFSSTNGEKGDIKKFKNYVDENKIQIHDNTIKYLFDINKNIIEKFRQNYNFSLGINKSLQKLAMVLRKQTVNDFAFATYLQNEYLRFENTRTIILIAVRTENNTESCETLKTFELKI